MFFKQIRKNAAKSRKTEGLFYGTLVIAIIACYTLLSLGSQDVMRFLETMESDAVGRVLSMIPVLYIVSLFFVFFLVYFAYNYQLEQRKKELGIYLILGMKRSRLFALLIGETLWNGGASLLIGLPAALFLTEMISLTTAKVVGMGIIGHKLSISAYAVVGTVVGFFVVQMMSAVVLSARYIRKEPIELLKSEVPKEQEITSERKGMITFLFGITGLLLAYAGGVFLLGRLKPGIVAGILVLGGAGTFLLYRGMGFFIGNQIRKKAPEKAGLYVFSGRQIQEHVTGQHRMLAVSSLLLLVALVCVSFGIGVAAGRSGANQRSVDFSVNGKEEEIREFINEDGNASRFAAYYPMELGAVYLEEHTFSWGSFLTALKEQPNSELRDNMVEYYGPTTDTYLISVASYNHLLKSKGEQEIKLEKNQVALYTSNRDSKEYMEILKGALKYGGSAQLEGRKLELLPRLYTDNIVADRKIQLYNALIVPEELFEEIFPEKEEPFCWNLVLEESEVQANGLMQEIQEGVKLLDKAGLEYESYLGGIGRNLFYTVASSYLTIYVGFLFLVIANTVLGIKALIQQKESRHRYRTLLMLGADTEQMCQSAQKQLRLFFGLSSGVAICSAVFGIISMFTSFLKLPDISVLPRVILLTVIAFAVFMGVEWLYLRSVIRTSRKEIQSLYHGDRRN